MENFVADAPKFPRAWLAVASADATSLRLVYVRKNSAQALFVSSYTPGGTRTPNHPDISGTLHL